MTARAYAIYLPRFLPGNPRIVVRNMPGGGHNMAHNYVYAIKPDGLTVLLGSGTVAVNQLLGMKSVAYDVLKMPLVISYSSSGVFFSRPAIVPKPEDLHKARGLIAGISEGSGPLAAAVLEFLGVPAEKVVLAYTGTADSFRAFITGETNMAYSTGTHYTQTVMPFVQKGEVVPVVQTGLFDEKGDLGKEPLYPQDIPTVKELYEKLYGKPASGVVWEAYRSILAAQRVFNQNLFLPPGMPDSMVRAYWDAAERMLKDPEFSKIAASNVLAGPGARWFVGEAADKAFKGTFSIDPKVVAWFKEILPKYRFVVE